MDCILSPPPSLYIEVLTLNVTVFTSMTFGEVITLNEVMRVGVWSNRIGVLVQRDQGALFLCTHREKTM